MILTGVLTPGKTRLVIETGKHFRPSDAPGRDGIDHYGIVGVRPDWTDNRSPVGYYNPITDTNRLTPFLDFLFGPSE